MVLRIVVSIQRFAQTSKCPPEGDAEDIQTQSRVLTPGALLLSNNIATYDSLLITSWAYLCAFMLR